MAETRIDIEESANEIRGLIGSLSRAFEGKEDMDDLYFTMRLLGDRFDALVAEIFRGMN